ncbi:tRNA (adenosine(37)-N6)-threonylcarbamoyltransferase complex dimerization subunit type 1 TsaB [Syntrophorhabdus aromaticivorans]|uniref:tRNA (Adenosine(37)-N6)-threonylcarbamoyltransferase complex dimerization subunit type 1 TsaB n=1 Tax=Syntrophorhabdus aromaticivorans TaxID=328301 RepID=A0A971S1K7_9BACT|nr:tRNA (adenosine(37)-N6)-threonylcarbamoyltransferase complex dimerization subunit type 1 TsaB [Syntrophorhabdus aromaticivorans]NLW36590.1 tRNA (adenosine(37)-N6)-threonylcarbamoyltransferase complex dimerization subunit type 1 TsaB [Syntrophorhabdus aromaticivorans]
MEGRLVLGLDNSLDFLNIALSREGELLEEKHIKPDKPPSQTVADEVLRVLADHGCRVEDLSLIVVTLGPGSFTGIRVGLAFCKGLASGRDIPLLGVPTLDVLAEPFSFLDGLYVCPLVDAKKGEVFLALYRAVHGSIERQTDYKALRPEEISGIIRTPCIFFGSGVRVCASVLSQREGATIIRDGFTRISGETLIKVGLQRANDAEVYGLNPVYGRRSEAEIKFGVKVL